MLGEDLELEESKTTVLTTTATLTISGRYKAGIYAELQKFGSPERDKQISLWPDTAEGDEPVIVSGNWRLTVGEDKALCAIQLLLDKTDYKGNRPGHECTDCGRCSK